MRAGVERWLEAERDQLILWLPVMIGAGAAAWFALTAAAEWAGTTLALAALGLSGIAIGRGGRAARAIAIAMLAMALGLALIWWRAERVSAPVLARTVIAQFTARVERVEPLPARELVRLKLAPVTGSALPPHLRVNLGEADVPAGLTPGATIRLRARLMPPPAAAVPGAYDFERVAWFQGIGATGRGFAPVAVLAPGRDGSGIRAALSDHITSRVPGSAGGIADALATGNVGAISLEDSEAMRRAGLAHLLSVSGLHITAAVGATMLVVLRLLSLSPWLALRFRLPLIAAGAGALAAIGYTLLTGAEVPTIRSCVAALLVLLAMAMGRDALTLRLVAAGATVVLLLWPEALVGPSFQLSFAAVTAIIALHEHPHIRGWFEPRDEGWAPWLARHLGSLLLTGLVVELALMPIALFHFHKAGIYGAVANIVAIPLTTFVIMPLEALALLFDVAGLGAPLWWLAELALKLLLRIAHATAEAPGAVSMLPAMPVGSYLAMVGGGLWVALWRTRWRRLGMIPFAIGAGWALATPAPDLLITGDGRHVAVRTGAGIAILRDRAGDYTRDTLAENGGVDGEPLLVSDLKEARCSPDLCLIERRAGGRDWRILATRSAYLVPARELIDACRSADIVVSERSLPRGCHPRWLRLDKAALAKTGGVAVTLASGRVVTVKRPGAEHPWRSPPTIAPALTPSRCGRDRSSATSAGASSTSPAVPTAQ